MMPYTHVNTSSPEASSSGARLVSVDGRELPLRAAKLSCDAAAGIARVELEQEFENPHEAPLTVTYTLPLPADGAVSGYTFTIGERKIVGEVDKRSRARERFERAIVDGHSAALLEQDRASVFRQEVGNIPPGQKVTVTITIDQPCSWLTEGAWEWRFPTVVAPRYLGSEGRVSDADRVMVDVASGEATCPRLALYMRIRDALAGEARPMSPSHALAVQMEADAVLVGLHDEAGARLDRDLVVRWPVATPQVGVVLDTGRPAADRPHTDRAYGLLTVVPPAEEAEPGPLPRDLIVLIDTSGSMHGEPLAQARRVVKAMVDTLDERDRLELIEFSMRPRRWKRRAVAANAKNREAACAWLDGLEAGGGTEMRSGIYAALHPLRAGSQRQVVLVTDGLIGFEEEIVETISSELSAGCRVHTIGVGSAVNRSLTGPAARAGRGTEVVCGIGEDVEPIVNRMVAATTAPLVVDLELSGDAVLGSTRQLPDLYAGAPALISLAFDPAGGPITVRGKTQHGEWTRSVVVPPCAAGSGNPAVTALYGREVVEDLELRRAAGDRDSEIDGTIETVGVEFQIATRLTSWIAVSHDPTVDPTEPGRRETMPQELAHGMSVEAFACRSAVVPLASPAMLAHTFAGAPMAGAAPAAMGPPAARRRAMFRRERHEERYLVEADEAAMDAMELGETPQAVVLEGRVRVHADGRLVIEIDLDRDLAWDCPAVVQAGPHELVVDQKRSTRSGARKAGQVLRLTLELATGAPVPPMIELRMGAGPVQVLLTHA